MSGKQSTKANQTTLRRAAATLATRVARLTACVAFVAFVLHISVETNASERRFATDVSHAAPSLIVVAAQNKPNIANDEDDAKPAPRKSTKNSNGDNSKRSTKTRTTARSRTGTATVAAPTTPQRQSALLNVTFATGMPDTQIFVQMQNGRLQSLGTTGADGKLNVRMPRGVFFITASRPGYVVQRQPVEIRAGNTNFAFNLTGMIASAAPATAEEILRRFSDPKQTERVTAADWQQVLAQSSPSYAQNPGDPQVKAIVLFAQGQLAYMRRDYGNALVAFNNAALVLPTSALAYYGLGNSYLATNQVPEALRAYQHAIELNRELAISYKGMGDALTKQGKGKEAFDYYERARALGYDSPAVSHGRARSLMQRKRWSEALKELLELSKTHPTPDVFIGIGDCYVALQQPLSAAPAYRRAMEAKPPSAIAYAKYGEVMFEGREYAAAAEALERALVLDPSGYSINRQRTRRLADQSVAKLRQRK
ncbi:MAG TPA: tetratricopeptide repeat protein [Pyrinomonadaceae bacterium]